MKYKKLTEKEHIKNIILESMWITRWNKNKTALAAVLKTEEAFKIYNDIIKNLKHKHYIIKYENRNSSQT